MDRYIGFAIMLFLLSMICERVADYLKHFLGEENSPVARAINRLLKIGNLIEKGLPASQKEEMRYFRILKINILCGFFTALALHADLFTILNKLDNPSDALTWKNYYWDWGSFSIKNGMGAAQNILIFLLGCFCTGLFISFGSKFWHDMLDLLLEVKNLKRKAADPRTFEAPENIKQFDEFINTPESRLAFLADEQYEEEIRAVKGVISVGPGYMETDKGKVGCLEVHFATPENLDRVKESYEITLSTGIIIPIPVNKIVTGVATTHANVFGGGMLLGNANKVNGTGSAGCVVKKKNPTDSEKNQLFILSCYHVLSGLRDLSVDSTADTNAKVFFRHNGNELSLGDLVKGERSKTMDAGIALITNTVQPFDNNLLFNPKKIRKVTSADIVDHTRVRIFAGFKNIEVTGTIHNDTWPQKIVYKDKPDGFELIDLFVLTNKVRSTFKTLTEEGDSGSLVLDAETNEALGIVVGGDNCFTYAVKMTAIEKFLDIELV